MDIGRIKHDLKDVGYAIIEHFLTPDQLENLCTVRMMRSPLNKLHRSTRKFMKIILKLHFVLENVQECETLREMALHPSSAWGDAASASCIFETLPGHICSQNPTLRNSYEAYKTSRSTWPLQSSIWDLLFTSQLTDLVSALLGPRAVLFNEQYIVKPSRGGDAASFAWHRDSDWCREGALSQPYISVWVALDHMTENNGCLIVRPHSHTTSPHFVHVPDLSPYCIVREPKPSISQRVLNELPLYLPAGSAVITTDVLEHCSGANTSPYARRAWMPQFSMAPVVWKETGAPVSLAIPLHKD